MIYINENTTKLQIPKLIVGQPNKICINDILRNQKQHINIDSSQLEINKYMYIIDFEHTELSFINGSQYEYYLYSEGDLLASGIIQCGEYNVTNEIQYNVEDKNYKQYNR